MKLSKKTLTLIIVFITAIMLVGCDNKKDSLENQVEVENEVSLGTWEGNTYSNDFFEIKYNMPDGWSYLSNNDLAKLMDLNFEAYENIDEYTKEVTKQITIYHFSANNPETGDTVQLLSENTIKDLTEDYYISALKDEFSNMEAVKYEIIETNTETLGKYIYKSVLIKAVDYDIYQKIYVRKIGKYFINILITSNTGLDTISEIVKSFE